MASDVRAADSPDPRVYFAAERTLLAWLRTGIGVMAFGFVVARFGLFLRLLTATNGMAPGSSVSPYLGAGLVALGAVASLVGAVRFRAFCRRLPARDLPAAGAATAPLVLTGVLVVLGFVLAIVAAS